MVDENPEVQKRDEEPDRFGNQPWQLPALDFTLDQVKEICLKIVPQWSHLKSDDLKVLRFFSGTLNYVYRVIPRIPTELPSVVFRVFEYSLDLLIDRDKESEAFEIGGNVGVGPKLLAKYKIGDRGVRIEEYIDGNTMCFKDYTDLKVVTMIGGEIARFHDLMTPQFNHWSKEPELIRCMNKWMECSIHDPRCVEVYNPQELKAYVDEYIHILKNKYANNRFAFNVVMCHNDIHLSNVLIHNNGEGLTLLDYEFIGHDFLGYDLCNFMSEACVDYKGVTEFPYLKVYVDMIYPQDLEQILLKTYLDKRCVKYDDEFFQQFRKDIKFIEVGWWLARVFFNAVRALLSTDEIKFKTWKIYSELCFERFKLIRQAAIDQGNWN